ncbi:MAG TPA: hypothetical protein PKH92_08465, partial [Anaerolineaceae bacterium]|nr:hypothetical protein [Anaerolineaceae bacterium]
LADPSHYPKVVYPLGFIFRFSAHPPSLHEIPKNAYPQVRNVGQTAGRAVQILGGRLRPLQLVHIPGIPETRYLVVMEKVAPTPAGYPRRTGIPAKKPL